MEFGNEVITYAVKSSTPSQRLKSWRRSSMSSSKKKQSSRAISTVRILTWNIDFMAPESKSRMLSALSHIQLDVFDDEIEPCCILFQEVDEAAHLALLKDKWVHDNFVVVPASPEECPSQGYNVVTLVSKSIPLVKAQSLVFGDSMMGRTALFVDLQLTTNPVASEKGEGDSKKKEKSVTFRVANTHLESLPVGWTARPIQLAAIASMLEKDGIRGGVVCGDMNIILPCDRDIHERAGLADAWTGDDYDEDGFTWGYQPPCEFPVGRLDRVFYTPNERCVVDAPQRVGVDLKTKSGRWVSDHYGLVTTVEVL